MALILHSHPLASFCHKVLIALYETGVPFETRLVDLGDPAARRGPRSDGLRDLDHH